ncbi:MAG: nucleotidyltransferase family protein, partial [Oscillospiraceae bacterium]|nr:nucleotidyltransferase family protein [Oscillospiraceae bacterium]
ALLSRLRALPAEAFAALPDAGEGLERRLARFAREEAGEDAILAAAAAKRYPAARLRRMLWAAALGLRRLDGEGTPPYLRVLAANGRGREVLAFLRKRCPLPLITKPADRRLDARGERVFSLCAAAADFYVLGFPDPAQRLGGRDVRTSPIMLRED